MSRRFTVHNESFTCVHCGRLVPPASRTCRNHCPYCLYSVHLDKFPGDRAADCGGLMQPVAVTYHSKKGYQLIHRCLRCGVQRPNRALLDDGNQPDSLEAILALMAHGGA
ncbi:RNHCP domain-containing protein [Alicyclobacillus kakegawensis]|uniref:RNHCP domain-containing protein n=1 Tax=Alicyclobacillus kakegawensis TaxID=392012 RepID=UPI00082CBAEA|nr:RNHCP domain-containing protein [Alicyclobacillus kakegawensis]